jgi:type I site-specific restriction endonuclease
MKGLIIGLIIGIAATWYWYQTDKGKTSITEITTVTNTVVKTVEQTRYVDQLRWVDVFRTNEVWKTNIVEKEERIVQVNRAVLSDQKTEQPESIVPVVQEDRNAPKTKKPVGLGGPRPALGWQYYYEHGNRYRIVNGKRKYE